MPRIGAYTEQFGTLFNPGLARYSITFQTNIGTVGDSGSVTDSWSDFATVRVMKFPISARERVSGEAFFGDTMYRYKGRYLSGITNAMRIVDGSETLDVIAVEYNDQQRNLFSVLARTVRSLGS